MKRPFALALAAGLAACSGTATVRPSVPARVSPAALPSPASAQLTLTIPVTRTPAYVSPSAASITVSSYVVSGGTVSGGIFATTTANLTAPACSTGSPKVCTINVVAPVGSAAFAITVFDGANGTGNALATLLPSATLAATIAADASNMVPPLALGGVPSSVTVSVSGTLTGGTPATLPVTVTAKDAQNNVIIGSAAYATPITLTSTDTSGAVTFTGTVTSPASTVSLSYNGNVPGGNATSVTVGASAGSASVTTASLSFTPAPLTLTCAGGCTGITNGPSPYALSLSENGQYTGNVAVTVTGSGCRVDPSTVAMVNGSGSVNVYGNPAGGTCTVTGTDVFNGTGSAAPAFAAAGSPTTITSPCPPGVTPTDPYGGFLYVNSCAGGTTVRYGSYTAYAFDSSANPGNIFVIEVYANTSKAPVNQLTVTGNRYMTGAAISSPYIVYSGQAGTTNVAWSSLAPP